VTRALSRREQIPMQVLLFSHDPMYASAAVAAGVAGVVVDWEWRGKAERQAGWNTQINRATVDDLRAIHAAAGDRVVCRINNSPDRVAECRLAIDNGAGEVWLPMVRSVDEVEACLAAIDGRAGLGVMVETREAMRLGRALSQLPLAHAYIGLHDYYIDGGSTGLFEPIVDGTLDRFREDYPGEIGFAGITRPGGGNPIPQRLLLAAMARLGCAFGVARRGFLADVPICAVDAAIDEIAAEMTRLRSRAAHAVDHDHALLAALVQRRVESKSAPEGQIACAP